MEPEPINWNTPLPALAPLVGRRCKMSEAYADLVPRRDHRESRRRKRGVIVAVRYKVQLSVRWDGVKHPVSYHQSCITVLSNAKMRD